MQGCWRKVTVDDFLPFLEESASATNGDVDTATATQGSGGGGDVAPTQVNYVPLYPRTGQPTELWPALLTKAVLKIAALEYVYNTCTCRYFSTFVREMSIITI